MSLLKELRVPVFKAGGMPVMDSLTYSLSVGGRVKEERHFPWEEILTIPKSMVFGT